MILFPVVGIGFFTALFVIGGFYRKWQLTNRQISIYLATCFIILFLSVNVALTQANILVDQGDFYLRYIRRGVLGIIFTLLYLLLRSKLIDFFDTVDRDEKKWLTQGALIFVLFSIWMILGYLGEGIAEQRGISPLDFTYSLIVFGPIIVVLILYIIGRKFLPQ